MAANPPPAAKAAGPAAAAGGQGAHDGQDGQACGGTLLLGAADTYTGGSAIEAGSTLDLGAFGAGGSGAITFGSGGDTLLLQQTLLLGNTLSNTIQGFATGDTIVIDGLTPGSGSNAVLTDGTLTVSTGGVTDTFSLAGDYASEYFHLNATTLGAGGGTAITSGPPRMKMGWERVNAAHASS